MIGTTNRRLGWRVLRRQRIGITARQRAARRGERARERNDERVLAWWG